MLRAAKILGELSTNELDNLFVKSIELSEIT